MTIQRLILCMFISTEYRATACVFCEISPKDRAARQVYKRVKCKPKELPSFSLHLIVRQLLRYISNLFEIKQRLCVLIPEHIGSPSRSAGVLFSLLISAILRLSQIVKEF